MVCIALTDKASMAPMLPTPASPQKRSLSTADFDAHPPKKQRQFYHRHHTLQVKQQSVPGIEPALVAQLPLLEEAETLPSDRGPKPVGRSEIDDFLDYSIISICKEVADRDGVTNSSIDSWALEMFRGHVEECMRGRYRPSYSTSLADIARRHSQSM